MALTEKELQEKFIPSHHPQYWQARRLAFGVIRALDASLRETRLSAQYVCDGYDEDGEMINLRENFEPFDRLIQLQTKASDNPNAMSILEAQKRAHIASHSYY